MRERIESKETDNKRFSIPAVVVALMIVVVCVSLLAVGIFSYINYSNNKKNNAYAAILYQAAEMSVASMKAEGTWDSFEKSVQTIGKKGNTTDTLAQSGENICYLVMQGDGGQDTVTQLVEKLVNDFIYDKSVFDGNICIALNLSTDQVSCVFYGKKDTDFVIGPTDSLMVKKNGAISDCSQRNLQKFQIGYCDKAIRQENETMPAPSIGDVRLENGEVLDLTWSVQKNKKSYTGIFAYKVQFYDEDKNLKLELIVNDRASRATTLLSASVGATTVLKCPAVIYEYDSDGRVSKTNETELNFIAYVDGGSDIHLILDAVDHLAGEVCAADAGKQSGTDDASYVNTLSAMRLGQVAGIDLTKKVYVTVAAVGHDGLCGAWKKSNAENLLMGKYSDSAEKLYTFSNARHLFNIRFMEMLMQDSHETVTYEQTGAFSWAGGDGILIHGNVFDTGKIYRLTKQEMFGQGFEGYAGAAAVLGCEAVAAGTVVSGSGSDETVGFMPIEHLSETSVLKGNGESIDSLVLLPAKENEILGLVRVNDGLMTGLKLDDVLVLGDDQTIAAAAVCGINCGEITQTEVLGGYVEGNTFVGGIAGIWRSTKEATALKNGAEIYGGTAVGGIIGIVFGNNGKKISVSQCENTGFVSCGSAYSGGIAGYLKYAEISACKSAPEAISSSYHQSRGDYGDFAGGIAGYCEASEIYNSGTDGGWVIGRDFVGGIFGYSDAMKKPHVVLDGNGMWNKASVYGRRYVGGITSVNAVVTATSSGVMAGEQCVYTVAHDYTEKIEMINWHNEGIVAAKDKYAGGIVGYNAAIIKDCEVTMDTSETGLERLKTMNGGDSRVTGSYVGGIAGCSSGQIIASEQGIVNNVYCMVRGKNYVGGVVGCNMPSAKISGYKLSGGTVLGQSFVGGYVGINHSAALLNGDILEASPSQVEGQSYVGGLIGGNLVLVEDNMRELTLNSNVHQSEGIVKNDGPYTGGIVGINGLFTSFNKNHLRGASICDVFMENDSKLAGLLNDGKENDKLIVSETEKTLFGGSDNAIGKMAGIGWKLTVTTPQGFLDSYGDMVLKSIEGQVYVGGAVGYHAPYAMLEIRGIRTKASVKAYGILNTADGMYAYAGGLMGYVPENAVIYQCMVAENTEISHGGTYRGSIAEVNAGWIINCESIGTDDRYAENIGGIAGINRESGTIKECRLTATLTGKNNVGGIVSRNQGKIKECVIDGDVNGYGYHIGGVAGMNDGTITDTAVHKSVSGMDISEDEKNILDDRYLTAAMTADTENTGTLAAAKDHQINGSCVGGIAGYSTGNIEKCTVESGGIKGYMYVGGFVGYQASNYRSGESGRLSELNNVTEVTADGFAGGIVGYIGGSAVVSQCHNTAVIYCNGGYAGGITAYSDSSAVIKQCSVSARVEAPNAAAVGGICGVNNGQIEQGKVSGGFKMICSNALGGIAGINGGHIILSTVSEVSLALQGGAPGSSVGGITGYNQGTIATSGTPVQILAGNTSPVVVTSNTTGSYVGGVAGYNGGIINGILPAEVKTAVYAEISMKNKAAACVGGISGKNTGNITGYIFNGYVAAFGSDDYGIGGIAGVNDSEEQAQTAVIHQCEVSDIRLGQVSMNDTGAGDTNKYTILSTEKAEVKTGGIAGYNGANGSISESTLVQCYVRGDYGYTGGIAGYNLGGITSCMAPTGDETSSSGKIRVKIYMESGSVGGIAGINEKNGEITNTSTGRDWLIIEGAQSEKEAEKSASAAGGIIGRNRSEKAVDGVDNYARVKKTAEKDFGMTGGIIGCQENFSSASCKIRACKNDGMVIGGNYTGAIVGQWRFMGGAMTECVNEGTVNAFGSGAGLVGNIGHLNEGALVKIEDCVNFGLIQSESGAGGIVGTVGENGDISRIHILGCSNAGAVTVKETQLGGIVGAFLDTTAYVSIKKCVNYYRAQNKMYNGIAANCSHTQVRYCLNIPESTAADGTSAFYAIGRNRTRGFDALNFTLGDAYQSEVMVINTGDSIPLRMKFEGDYYSGVNESVEEELTGLPYDPNSDGNRSKDAKTYYETLHEMVMQFLDHFQ